MSEQCIRIARAIVAEYERQLSSAKALPYAGPMCAMEELAGRVDGARRVLLALVEHSTTDAELCAEIADAVAAEAHQAMNRSASYPFPPPSGEPERMRAVIETAQRIAGKIRSGHVVDHERGRAEVHHASA